MDNEDKLDYIITRLAKLEVYIENHKELITQVSVKLDAVEEIKKSVARHDILFKVGAWVVGLFTSLLAAKLFNKI